MADNKKVKRTQAVTFVTGKRRQAVLSEPRLIFVKRYLTAKGVRLVNTGTITPEEADKKYGKNLYRLNPNARVVKRITHDIITKSVINLEMVYPKYSIG